MVDKAEARRNIWLKSSRTTQVEGNPTRVHMALIRTIHVE